MLVINRGVKAEVSAAGLCYVGGIPDFNLEGFESIPTTVPSIVDFDRCHIDIALEVHT